MAELQSVTNFMWKPIFGLLLITSIVVALRYQIFWLLGVSIGGVGLFQAVIGLRTIVTRKIVRKYAFPTTGRHMGFVPEGYWEGLFVGWRAVLAGVSHLLIGSSGILASLFFFGFIAEIWILPFLLPGILIMALLALIEGISHIS